MNQQTRKVVSECYGYVYYISVDGQERMNTDIPETKKLLEKIRDTHITNGEYTVVCYQVCTKKNIYDNYTICIFDNYMDSVKLQNELEYTEGIAIQVYQVTSLKYIMIKAKTYDGQCYRCYSGKTPENIDSITDIEASPLCILAKKLYNVKTALVCVK